MKRNKHSVNPLAPRPSKVIKSASKTKKQKLVNEPKVFKSAETISISDDEEDDDELMPDVHPTSALGAGKGKAIARQVPNGVVTNRKSPSSKQKKPFGSGSTSEDTDSDGNRSSDTGAKTNAPVKLHSKTIRSSSASEIESSDNETEDRAAGDVARARASKKSQSSVASAIKSGVEDEQSGSDSSERSDDDDSSTDAGDASSEQSGESSRNQSIEAQNEPSVPDVRPTTDFKPPSGFQRSGMQSIASSNIALFDPKSLQGKEIWHISAPASLPIGALKEIAVASIASTTPIMTHGGVEYSVYSDRASREATRLLMPRPKSGGYFAEPHAINHVLQFQQVVNVRTTASTGIPSSSAQVLLDPTAPTKPQRKAQPSGLKMRFRPSGFGEGILGDIGSSSDDEQRANGLVFRRPQNVSQNVKRKNEPFVHEATSKIDADQPTAPAESRSVQGKKKKRKDKEGLAVAETMQVDEITARMIEKESAEQKRLRKERRRAEKLAKASMAKQVQ